MNEKTRRKIEDNRKIYDENPLNVGQGIDWSSIGAYVMSGFICVAIILSLIVIFGSML